MLLLNSSCGNAVLGNAVIARAAILQPEATLFCGNAVIARAAICRPRQRYFGQRCHCAGGNLPPAAISQSEVLCAYKKRKLIKTGRISEWDIRPVVGYA